MSRLPFGRWIAAVAVSTVLILMGLATLATGPSQEGIPISTLRGQFLFRHRVG